MADSAHALANDTDLSAADRIDCESFARAVERANAGHKRRSSLISDAYLARIAGPLGGSKYSQSWWRYRHGRRAIPLIDKMIAAMVFEMRPQDLFPSWRFSVLTPIAPNVPGLGRFIRIFGALNERERDALLAHIEEWLAVPAPRGKAKKQA